MITVSLDPQTLGNTRFAISPLAEVTLSLRLLTMPGPVGHPHSPWFRGAAPRLRTVDLELLLALAPVGRRIASCLIPSSSSVTTTIGDQLSDLAALSATRLNEEFLEIWSEHPPPMRVRDRLRDRRAFEIIADTLLAYWQAAIEPFWPRMRIVLDEDIALRAGSLAHGRMFDMLNDLHHEISVEGDTLLIDKPTHADHSCRAAGLTLIPAIFAWPQLVVDQTATGTLGITYGANGAARAWESSAGMVDRSVSRRLAALLGRGRSQILAATAMPLTTAQIATTLGKSRATVSEHLTVLRQNGLVSPHRAGRRVLYWQTPLAESLIEGLTT